ncbi:MULTISPECIES: aromatase/cyclase [Streptomyces]|uniref:aromatase/cyclase n=1 Tax=Streptomyces TaxID=1883 RepID=UPI00163BA3ED|nr:MULTISPECIES: SRPBCC family protein [Streptomyces]MBC2878700.1 SRPBCC family protein [Streptomyces sp. TYQ1024]UBI35144.1 SRPBCC family protein [Streptomyces mobaraensis]UKW27738.1 SRPBCC family protein [Streptomyces sp. TYQ1024]
MAGEDRRGAEHTMTVRAPVDRVYGLVAAAEDWPRVFPPLVHVDCLERTGRRDVIRVWAVADGEPRGCVSRRVLAPDRRCIGFRQEVPAPPVAFLGGRWEFEPVSARECRVRLWHEYRAVDDDPRQLARIGRTVVRRARAELEALRRSAELGVRGNELLLSFEDSVRIAGSAGDVYAFVREAQLWSERLPSAGGAAAVLAAGAWGRTPCGRGRAAVDGRDAGRNDTVRVCFPPRRIVFKQTRLPALLSLHTGSWLFTPCGDGVTATSRHTVAVDPAAIGAVLGEGAGVAQAKDVVRSVLGTDSRLTLRYAKEYAEARCLR